MNKSCLLTIVSGGSYTQRETTVAAAIAQSEAGASKTSKTSKAVILEGLPDGCTILSATDTRQIQRIAPGCMCCIGNLVLRVTLNRILKNPPARLYLGLANAAHLDQLITFLQSPPYSELLQLDQDLRI